MEREQIISGIKEILQQVINVEGVRDWEKTEDLLKDKGLNSLEAIHILVAVEDRFDIEIDDDDLNLELVKTIENIADYVERKLEV